MPAAGARLTPRAGAAVDWLGPVTPYARSILQGGVGTEPPIRAELFGVHRFEEHGRSLARAQLVEERPIGGAPFFPRVEENLQALRSAYDQIALTSRSGHYVTPAAEWLLDNFHLVEAQLEQIREGVPRRYYADLPKLAAQPLAGLPRVYGIAWAYVAHTDSVLDPQTFTAFLNAYQEVSELRLSELWALPTTLRVVLLENLRRMADEIAAGKLARDLAHAVGDAAEHVTDEHLDSMDAQMTRCGLRRAWLTQLWQRVPIDHLDSVPALVKWMERHCPDGPALVMESQSAQVAANLTVSNIITTLRLIGQIDWVELIEPVSRPLQLLRQLPSFGQESEITRQQITRAMEQLARQSRRPEREVAQEVVALAQASSGPPVQHTAGYYLIGEGRNALAAALHLPRPPRRRHSRLWLYTLAIALGSGVLLWLAAHRLAPGGWWEALSLFLLAWPASEAAASLVHRLLAESLKIELLPRLELAGGITAQDAVLVVIPTMLTSPASTRELLAQLERHWLANREPHAQFALLTDWADADAATLHTDAALLADAVAQLKDLNARSPAAEGAPPRFLLIHRPRSWCETQQRWLGWERKRGKLEMLVRALATGGWDGFLPLAPGLRLASGIRFILTLDSDTGLPPGALRDLVAIGAHPLNEPKIDARARRVVAGYGILQPRLVTPLTADGRNTRFHQMFAGQAGLDPYNSAVSDVYQDLFGTASFTGKGLLNVAACHAVLDARLPGEAVLSHDLLEGSIARCGFVSDVTLVEEYPQHPGVAASRLHRWTRGDWQLLPLMRHAKRFGIDSLGLWKMSDNLRRSLVQPACAALLALSVFEGSLGPASAIVMVFGALLAGPLLSALAGLVPTRRHIAWRHFFHVGRLELQRALAGAAWQFSQLAAHAGLLLDAILRSLWRLAVSRRKLLEWTTAAQAQAAARQDLGFFVRQHWPVSLLCIALAAASLLWGVYPRTGFVLFALWACSPLTNWWAARMAGRVPVEALREKDRLYLQALARDTWRFFERCVGAEDNHLPPDNLQLVPEEAIAHRTSPTNIGLYLLAACCAREFGWISTGELTSRLQATLDTIDRLEKHRGHLLNWYDTRTLAVLPPAYVSTVDSGNLAGLLLTVAQACRELARQGTDGSAAQAALLAIAGRCRALGMAMDFGCVYDGKRHLFHIGLRVQEQVLDASYYDLLASESRLTSLFAIAKGDVPRRHWGTLGRPFLSVGVTAGLKSWSGSMFEYLMPSLLMPEPVGGLLHSAACAAVAEQQATGEAMELPWGISESAYFAQDHSLAFQYGPFGAPRLALRRTPPGDRVIAPYASLLASMFQPAAATANLQRLEVLGGRGALGMYESIDFTVSRQPADHPFSVVQTFMAHHHGMSIVALCNVLCADAPRRWFTADALVMAHEMLLHEGTPRQIVESADPRHPPEPGDNRQHPVFQSRSVLPLADGWQPTHLLSNGRYSVALRANGAGVSRWNGQNISRWRDDLLRDAYGSFFYLRREGQPGLVSLTASPAPGPDWRYHARFMADRVQFDARGDEIEAGITVLVSPEDDTELRIVTLRNTGRTAATYELVSSFEPVLAAAAADEAHPAFSNLFIQSVWRAEWRALVMTRRPRLHGDPEIAAAHFLAGVDGELQSIECITDRRSFRGRNRPLWAPALAPQALDGNGAPVNGLDPVACLRVRVRLAPGALARLTFATTAAQHEGELETRIDSYLQSMHVERAERMAATLAQVRLRDLGLAPEENLALQDLTTALMYSAPRAPIERAPLDQRALWRFGLSGDKPIVLVRVHSSHGIPLVQSLLRAQPWWSFGGLAVDVVVLNSEPNSYLMPLQRDILALRDRLAQAVQNSFPRSDAGGFFLLREQEVSVAEKAALVGHARAILSADGRPLDVQVAALRELWAGPAAQALAPVPAAIEPGAAKDKPAPVTGVFDAPSGEFRFDLAAGQAPPRPWVNVIANPGFGFQVSETGSGYTWSVNSRLHQVSAWSNDPVADPASEHWLLQDLDSGEVLSLARAGGPLRVRHGQGYSVFESAKDGIEVETTFFADREQPAKIVRVRLENVGTTRRRLRAVALVEWQLGANRGERRGVASWKSATLPAVFGQQREQRAGFGGHTGFVTLTGGPRLSQWTCDRSEFFDIAGRLGLPERFAGRAGTGLDPCAALAADLVLAPGQSTAFAFVLGHGTTAAAAQDLAASWQNRDPLESLSQVKRWWSQLQHVVQVRTPDPLFDAMVNQWLLYQTVSCRIWSKAGFYQAGGASGFRDQLQDAMALGLADPQRLREQIVLNAARQFPEGDVQHWWHAPGGEGVRTHFSDDLLWLPYACAHYLETSGDAGLLEQQVPFLEGPQIPDGAEDAYYTPQVSEATASVYEHCARTIDRSLKVGQHGLPLMGTGDWNDGMNRVGQQGKGESVWLAWFLCTVVERFAPVAQARDDGERARRWLQARDGWIAALHAAGWDGGWFRRAFFDNGAPLGSQANDECRIDLIAQAWSVLSGASTPAFTGPALAAMKRQLVDDEAGLLKLLTPPLQHSENNPGYIQAYPPGVRENGGQYSHGAVWALMAQALSGDREGAWASFQAISPAHRSQLPARAAAYELEPYVTAGDIYSEAPYVGRGGWSWYTGSAAWLYRAAVETLLGLSVRPGALSLSPRLPAHWPAFEIRLQLQGRDIRIHWERDLHPRSLVSADRQVAWGEWVELDQLPRKAVLLVRGDGPAGPAQTFRSPAVPQPA
ncbi:GH36-type glycosyl hydrolase domain-containing protein [Caenimonas terrae]|uniref:GH36-type glycosyl hydrolase domain-containing protein n=1 Tax=Caenimonas terrae TaxID=696074 RepID=A0ABW0NI08_9BURK